MNTVKTRYGTLIGVKGYDTYFDGQVKDCIVGEENEMETEYGVFIPQYCPIDASMNRSKKRRSSVSFFENGNLKSIALEHQTMVKTPMGEMPAELVTFYQDGPINRVFPLNSEINGFWSEEDEESLCIPFKFSFSFASFEAKIIGVRFYETGQVKSITLWPGEVVTIMTPQGEVATRTGIALYKDGSLKSIEPMNQTLIKTPIGVISAHDNDVLGIHGDTNSLQFMNNGKLHKLTTYKNGIVVKHVNGVIMVIEPQEVESYIDMNETMILPLKLVFDDEFITVLGKKTYRFSLKDHEFKIKQMENSMNSCSGVCSSCSSYSS